MQRLQILADAVRAFAEVTAEPRRLLDTIVQRTSDALGSYCGLALLSSDETALEHVAVFDQDPAVLHVIEAIAPRVRLALDSPHPFARAMQSSAPSRIAVTPEIIRTGFASARDQDALLGLDLETVLLLPLRARGRLVGGVFLARHGARSLPFDDDDVQLARTLGDHAALAIANAELLARSQHLAERLELMSELAQEFAANVADYPALLVLVARRLCDVVGDGCVIRMIADDKQHFETPGTIDHVDPDRLEGFREIMTASTQHLSRGMTGHVATTGETVLIPHVDLDQLEAAQGPAYRRALEEVGIKSILVVALRAQGVVIGTCGMCRTQAEEPYSDEDRHLLESLAAHASLAIANSRLLAAGKRELADRMRTEEVLRRGFLEAAPDAVLILDATGTVQLVNTQAENLFGWQRTELVGRSMQDLVPPDSRAIRRDGTSFTAEVKLSQIETPDGVLVAAAVRDVTERLREIEERSRQSQEANRLKSEFLANMSHELRTPMNAVIGFASLMHAGKAGPISDVHKEYVGDILSSARHLLQLINDILDLAKVEAGRMELRVEPVDLAKVAGEVRDILRGLATEKNIKIVLELDPAVSDVAVDGRLLKQVLYNYLSNAIKFTRDSGCVTVRTKPEGDDAFRIEVQDTGIGIGPHDIERLFVEFQQLDPGKAKKYPGTGLGLALTKRIVEAQGGRVHVTSAVGVGSTFSAILPRVVTA